MVFSLLKSRLGSIHSLKRYELKHLCLGRRSVTEGKGGRTTETVVLRNTTVSVVRPRWTDAPWGRGRRWRSRRTARRKSLTNFGGKPPTPARRKCKSLCSRRGSPS